MKLVAIPAAGTDATLFRLLGRAAADTIMLDVPDLPGRGTRAAESPHRHYEPAVRDLADVVSRIASHPTVVLGHSMGAALGYLAVAALRERDVPISGLIVSGMPPLHVRRVGRRSVRSMSDIALGERASRMAPFGSLGRADRRWPLDLMRADLELCETLPTYNLPILDCPIIAIAGDSDRYVPAPLLPGWADYTTARCTVEVVRGGHFYFLEHRREAVAAVRGHVCELVR